MTNYIQKDKMKKKEIKKKLKEFINDPNYEFRFQMAGAYASGDPIFKCGVCENMVNGTVQTLYHKTEPKSIGFCADCYQILIGLKNIV
jgi:hypothetical protein